MPLQPRPEAPADALFTAIDLGSNSFCMIQGRFDGAEIARVEFQRESVRLVAGIDRAGRLHPERERMALECLERFGRSARHEPTRRVRAVATSSARRLAQPRTFLARASKALGHPVEIIDGQEEGRLIWLGATGALPSTSLPRLIIDIGGGSTELVVGTGNAPAHIASTNIGCVIARTRFFADGAITPTRWQQALEAMQADLAPALPALTAHGWDEAWASSGSARAIGKICRALGSSQKGLNATAIVDLRQRLLAAGHVDRVELPELSDDGRPVVAGTVAVLDALFQSLEPGTVGLCKSAMREGILRDLAGDTTVDGAASASDP